MRLGTPSRALGFLRSTIACEPDHAPGHFNLGFASALLGDLARGWTEFHWYSLHRPRRYFEQPFWRGEETDATVLVWADQALGDAIQYVRYVPLVARRTARVILQCSERLAPLLARVEGVARVIGLDAPLPAFDAQVPLSYLPEIFQTRLDIVPSHVPYLAVDPALIDEWAQRLGPRKGVRVGLVWGGDPSRNNAHVRFAPLSAFAPLAGVRGVRFISLQQGTPAVDLMCPPRGLWIEAYPEESRSIADSAALILNLDLLITVDTMTAHLAGALGKPVWTLLARTPDWRWHLDTEVSPWYPTMRLFRQVHDGDWASLLALTRAALDNLTL
jgi:hypothetical protein